MHYINRKYFLLGFLAMYFATICAQQTEIKIPTNSQFTTDKLGNIIVFSPNNDIIKYDKDGKILANTNIKVFGNIASIDASNPFEIYIFYADQNKLLLLDNLLNQMAIVDLEYLEISQIACLSRSFDNQIWLFDAADFSLKKYSKDLKLMLESASFSVLPIAGNIFPTFITDNNPSIFILNKGSILQFDIFGNFNKSVLSDSVESFQMNDEKIFYLKHEKIYFFDPKNFTASLIFSDNLLKIKSFRIEKETLYILTDEFVILQPLKKD